MQNECFMVLNSPFTKTSYIDVSPLPFWSSLRPIWDTASQAAVHILPQVKLNSQLSNYSFFFFFFLFKSTVMVTSMGPRVDFLPSTELHNEPELWYQQWPLMPIHLLRECRWIWVSPFWFLNLPCWLRLWVLFCTEGDYLLPPSRKDTRGLVGGGWGSGETSAAYSLMI